MKGLLDEGKVSMNLDDQSDVVQFVTVEELDAAVTFDPNNLTDALIKVSSRFARFGLLSARARMQRDGLKTRLEVAVAKYDKAYRDKFSKEGSKVTEPRLKSLVESHPKVVEIKLKVNEATGIYNIIEATKEAIKVQRDALVQLNKNAESDKAYTHSLVSIGDRWESAKK